MRKNGSTVLALLLALSMGLSACNSYGGLAGTRWVVVSYGPAQAQAPVGAGIATSFQFQTDGTYNWIFGCNLVSGNYRVSGDSLVFTQTSSTGKACLGDYQMQEAFGLKFLTGQVHYVQADKTLTLSSAGGDELVLTYSTR